MMDEEKEYILKAIERGRTDAEISQKIMWPVKEVAMLRAEMFPTAGLAKYLIKANAQKLAQRIIDDCNVEEAIDILSRPNIGVLAPAVKNQPGPMKASFLTSINPADLGGVKVAAMISTEQEHSGIRNEDIPSVSEVEPELTVPLSALRRQEEACDTSPPKVRKVRKQRSPARPKSTLPFDPTQPAPEN